MKREYDVEYVSELETRVQELERELHVWQMNGVMLDVDVRAALYIREMERIREKMDEDERRDAERADELMLESGL